MSEPPKAKGKEIESEKGYALFDLDQTLIPWDTQLLFCNWILRRYPARRILMLVFMLFLPLFKILGAGGMKRVFIIYLVGFKEDELDQEVKAFVEWLLDRYTYPEIVQRLEQEKQDGKRTILTSASPEFYVIEIGKQLGFDYAYGTRFSWKDSVPLFPDLDRENNKGTEKVRRMRAEGSIPPDDGLSYSVAYSDSKADLPILELCEHGVLVNPSDQLAAYGEEKDWEIQRPNRPTKGKLSFGWACVRQMLGVFPL